MTFLEKITDSIYAHTQGKTIGNVGVIAGDHGNYVIDTSMYPTMARDIRREIEEIKSGRMLGAILTHYHFDHSGGNQVFHPHIHAHRHVLHNMKTYDSDEMRENLKKREDSHMFEDMKLTLPTHVFVTNPYHPDESDQIEVIQVGGHTNGSSLIFYEPDNVVFTGDNLFAGFFPWGGDPTASPYDWLNATHMLLEKKPKIIIPGHGEVQHTDSEIQILKDYLEKVIKEGERLISEGLKQDDCVDHLLEVDSNPEKNQGMKERTLKHWYNVITNHIK